MSRLVVSSGMNLKPPSYANMAVRLRLGYGWSEYSQSHARPNKAKSKPALAKLEENTWWAKEWKARAREQDPIRGPELPKLVTGLSEQPCALAHGSSLNSCTNDLPKRL